MFIPLRSEEVISPRTCTVKSLGRGVTKLDGTAKGGILFALAATLGLPIRFIGVGEAYDDLQIFNARDFAEAVLGDTTTASQDAAQ